LTPPKLVWQQSHSVNPSLDADFPSFKGKALETEGIVPQIRQTKKWRAFGKSGEVLQPSCCQIIGVMND